MCWMLVSVGVNGSVFWLDVFPNFCVCRSTEKVYSVSALILTPERPGGKN